MMTDPDFEALVARLDLEAQRNPSAYRLKVILLACAGYAYVALVLVIAGALFAAALATTPYLKVLAIKLALVFGAFFWVVASAMWIRLESPQGRRITRSEAPELFDMIDTLKISLRALTLHDVLITNEFNAAVAQTPRLGLLGWHRNTLLIGLPLMKGLTHEQLAAVLAHELGHLAGGHGRLGNWVYRLRFGWVRLAKILMERRSAGSFAFRPFFKWYVPYFCAVSFPLARANEYVADAASARLTSSTATAAALTSVNVIGSFLEARYWPDLHRKAAEIAEPSLAPYAQMGDAIRGNMDAAAMRGWLEVTMANKTSIDNTHPALADRLHAIGEPPLLALPSAGEAADTVLGSALESITAEFDRCWREAIRPWWELHHREVKAKREQLVMLDARLEQGATLPIDELLQRACLTGDVGAGAEAAVTQLRALYAEAPDSPAVCYQFGLHLLKIGDDAGISLIEHAIQHDEHALLSGTELLRDYHASHGRVGAAQRWHERWLQLALALQVAQAERASIQLSDRFEAHGLDSAQVAALRVQLRAIPSVGRAYLVRKHVTQFPDQSFLVLGFTIKLRWRWQHAKRAAAVLEHVANTVKFPEDATIICADGANYRFGLKWRFMRGARVV